MLATSTLAATSAARFPTTFRDFPDIEPLSGWGIAALATGVP
jgi:hypothetical protein